ncbi:hypothetical protein [Deinococcus psychrotolerans]|uniref:hypothetical protein n=1 Tax=Deinococcus psychrotolerans TaxID=2489213 RepID=UPI0013DDBDAE|nr:hypothetical protein [Deinococcus psychrotolerans]
MSSDPNDQKNGVGVEEDLERQERIAAYQQCAQDFALDAAEQHLAQEWLEYPVKEE